MIPLIFALIFSVSAALTSPVIAHAATPGPDQVLQVNITPENPNPGDVVTITIGNNSYNLDKADIAWSVNGSVSQQATGLKTFETTIPATGGKTDISVDIKTIEGVEITQNFPFNITGVSLVWEANTYVPPWYEGKALFTPQATGRVIAVPQIYSNGALVDPSTLIYDWTDNGSEEPDQSGYGDDVYYFIGDIISRPRTIGVTVTQKSGTLTANGQITIDAVEPTLRIYANDPTYGLQYQTSVGNEYDLSVPEVSFQAIPFFFSADTATSPDLTYSWLSNGSSTNQTSPFITFRNEGQQGTSQISLEVDHVTNILQAAQTAFSVIFTPTASQQKNAFSL